MVVVEGRVELMRPMDPAPIDDHHHLFAGFTKDVHDLMEVLAEFLGIKMGDDLIKDARGPILHGTNDTEQHAPGDATPRAVLHPRLPFATFFLFDLALAQRACGQAIPLGFATPARAGQGKAPHDRFVFIEQNDLATMSLVLQGGEFESAVSEIGRGGIKATSGTIVAYLLFFNASRTLSRLTCTPV